MIGKIHDSKESNFGYNAGTGAYEDLVAAGVIDPDQGHPDGTAERRLDRRPDADDRSDDLGESRRRRKQAAADTSMVAAAAWTACTKQHGSQADGPKRNFRLGPFCLLVGGTDNSQGESRSAAGMTTRDCGREAREWPEAESLRAIAWAVLTGLRTRGCPGGFRRDDGTSVSGCCCQLSRRLRCSRPPPCTSALKLTM